MQTTSKIADRLSSIDTYKAERHRHRRTTCLLLNHDFFQLIELQKILMQLVP